MSPIYWTGDEPKPAGPATRPRSPWTLLYAPDVRPDDYVPVRVLWLAPVSSDDAVTASRDIIGHSLATLSE